MQHAQSKPGLTWDTMAEISLTGDVPRARAARETFPALARKARHRKPNRRRGSVLKAGAALVVAGLSIAAAGSANAVHSAPSGQLVTVHSSTYSQVRP